MAKIGIVLATYNGEKYLPQMLDSLASQTRAADFIAVIDDGSSDGTLAILNRYKGELPLQITALEKNSGHRAAFSKALELAMPQLSDDDFVALADQDDIWLPQKLERLEEEMNVQDANGNLPILVQGDAQVIDEKNRIIGESWRQMDHIPETLSLRAILTGFTNVTGCMTLFRANLLRQVLPIPPQIFVHDQWIAFCASAASGCRSIGSPVIQYRIHGENAIGLGHNHTWSGNLRLNLQWAKTIAGTPHFKKLSTSDRLFLTRYIRYVEDRLDKPLLPGHLIWVAQNAHSLFPHVKGKAGLIPRILYGIVGAPVITRISGKK